MLEFGAVAADETNLRQGVVEPRGLGDLRQLDVVGEVPVGALRNLADDEAA